MMLLLAKLECNFSYDLVNQGLLKGDERWYYSAFLDNIAETE